MLNFFFRFVDNVAWQIKRAFLYYSANLKQRVKNARNYDIVQLVISPISLIPEAIALMRIDYHELIKPRVATKTAIGAALISVREDRHELRNHQKLHRQSE